MDGSDLTEASVAEPPIEPRASPTYLAIENQANLAETEFG